LRIGEKLVKAFEVQVKRRGKFRFVGERLPRGRALALGAKITAETAARSFRIIPRGFTARRDIPFKLGQMFRPAIRKGKPVSGIIVERTKYAIDAPIEKRQIPGEAKRLRALGLLRTKRKRKRR